MRYAAGLKINSFSLLLPFAELVLWTALCQRRPRCCYIGSIGLLTGVLVVKSSLYEETLARERKMLRH
jgi:hypothetical protein